MLVAMLAQRSCAPQHIASAVSNAYAGADSAPHSSSPACQHHRRPRRTLSVYQRSVSIAQHAADFSIFCRSKCKLRVAQKWRTDISKTSHHASPTATASACAQWDVARTTTTAEVWWNCFRSNSSACK